MSGPQTQRRRVIRAPIASGQSGSFSVTQEVPLSAGLAQHQIFVAASGVPAAGVVQVSVRPAKASFYVPIGSIDLSKNGSGLLLVQALIDAVQVSTTTGVSAGITVQAGLCSVGDDFTPGHNLSDVARRRFAQAMIASGWNGSGVSSQAVPEQQGFAQHQVAVAGGTGTVKLLGRPVGFDTFVDIAQGCDALNASGQLQVFAGLFDAFMAQPVGTVSGSVNVHVCGVGEELMLPSQPWLSQAMTAIQNDLITSSNGSPLVTSAGDFITTSAA